MGTAEVLVTVWGLGWRGSGVRGLDDDDDEVVHHLA